MRGSMGSGYEVEDGVDGLDDVDLDDASPVSLLGTKGLIKETRVASQRQRLGAGLTFGECIIWKSDITQKEVN